MFMITQKRREEDMKARMKDPLTVFESAKTPGQIIRAFRNNFEIAQDEMAYACAISQANLSAIENGRRLVGPSVALKLAAFIGLSPEVILYPNGYQSEPKFIEVKKRKSKMTGT